MDDLVNYYLYNAYYPREYNEVIDKYVVRKKEILSEFSNSKINNFYLLLNQSFDTLRRFLTDHFSIPNNHYEMHKNPPFLYLEPSLHHNFRLSEGGKRGKKMKIQRNGINIKVS